MKRLIAVVILMAASGLAAQVSLPNPQSRVGGRFVAFNYGNWAIPLYTVPSGTGSKTFAPLYDTVTLSDGRSFMPFATNAPLTVGNETVTVTAVGSGCTFNNTVPGACVLTATFSNTHTNADKIGSGTFGLQESLNDAGASGGGAVVIDSAWSHAGGTSAMVSAATLPANTGIEDTRIGSGASILIASTNPTGNACTAGVPMLYYSGTYYGCDGTGHYAALAAGGTPSDLIRYVAAKCQSGAAGLAFSSPLGSSPTPYCYAAVNGAIFGSATFTATSQSVQDHFTLPSTWTGAIDLSGVFSSVGITGNVLWDIQTGCVAAGSVLDPTFNAAQVITVAAQGTTLQMNTLAQATLTTTGCVAGSEFFWILTLDPSTTTTGNENLITLTFKVRRTS